MSTPISNFGFSRNNLTVSFQNLTLNIEAGTTFAWDFGDGNNSTEKNPIHNYVEAGFFSVKLTSTTLTEVSEINIAIGVGSLTSMLNTPVLSLCFYYLPSTFLIKNEQLVTLIQTWQVYLQPLMENPLVDTIDTHNELQWSALSNKLIAMLVAKDIIISESTAYLANAANEGSSASSTSSASNNLSRSIKSIETGPVRTEWYEGNNHQANSETLKNIGDSFRSASGPNGIVDQLKKSICTLASRIEIYLPECGQNKPYMNFKLGGTPDIGSALNSGVELLYQDAWETNINW